MPKSAGKRRWLLFKGQEADTSNSIASRMSSSGDWASARNCNRTTRPVSHQVKVLDDAPSQSLSQEDEALLSVQPALRNAPQEQETPGEQRTTAQRCSRTPDAEAATAVASNANLGVSELRRQLGDLSINQPQPRTASNHGTADTSSSSAASSGLCCDLSALQRKLQAPATKILESEDRKCKLQSEKQQLLQVQQSLSTDLTSAQKRIQQLEAERDLLCGELESQSTKIDLLNTDKKQLQSGKEQLAKQCQEANEVVSKLLEEQQMLKHEVDGLRVQYRRALTPTEGLVGSQDYCNGRGAANADFDLSRVKDYLERLLGSAVTEAASAFHNLVVRTVAGGDTVIRDEVHAVLAGPLLQLVDKSQYNEAARHHKRAWKAVYRNALLQALQQLVWSTPVAGSAFAALHEQLEECLPPFGFRAALLCNFEGLKTALQQHMAAVEPTENTVPWQVTTMNGMLDAQAQLSKHWFGILQPLVLAAGQPQAAAALAAEGVPAVEALLQESLQLAMQTMSAIGLESTAEHPEFELQLQRALQQLIIAAVVARLCVEASHPGHVISVTAGTAGHWDAASYGGSQESAWQFIGSTDVPQELRGELDAGTYVRVLGSKTPGVVFDPRLMLLAAEECAVPVIVEKFFSVYWE